MNINKYLSGLKDKRVAVIGIGISNEPLIRLLLKAGARVTACDKKSRHEFGSLAVELEALGAELKLGDEYLSDLDHEIIFRTPGMHPDKLKAAKDKGSVITSEMEAFFEVCPCKIIAVTGSDGKTTTATIISEMLKAAGKTVWLGGNIGTPLFSEALDMEPEDIVVLELSSFQLITMTASPDVAVVTNVAPNHLDVHNSMEEYINSKMNIFLHQSPDGVLVLNYDNDITRGFADSSKGEVRFFSRKTENGVYYKNGTIYSDGRELLKAENIKLQGLHNIENYMAAIAAVKGLASDEDIRGVAAEFEGVAHRIELVRVHDGVNYYNDSMGTSPTRTIAGLRSFKQRVILIAGGYDKHIPYDELGPVINETVKTLVLTGATAEKIRASVITADNGTKPDIITCEKFDDAVLAAVWAARAGDIVFMSPASASFDCFKNYAERGAAFKNVIDNL